MGGGNHVGDDGAKGKASTSSGQQDEMTRNLESTTTAPSDPRQVSWPSDEEIKPVRADSEELAKTMVAGLVGAALQGNIRKKDGDPGRRTPCRCFRGGEWTDFIGATFR